MIYMTRVAEQLSKWKQNDKSISLNKISLNVIMHDIWSIYCHDIVPNAIMNAIISLSLFDLVISFLRTAPECLMSKHSFYFPWLIYIDSLDKPFPYL